ncbi:Histone deacetylation protein Rxt3 [Artemisia annua]|uniref:Histone deacetylation protein Rxt3 n=1 Tax=Artemisia annua TaxID=35608 RepID=A0A2U1NII9_ARTAN|nr:Histone deacetylation protein Rxt3 [Artemisia annua]
MSFQFRTHNIIVSYASVGGDMFDTCFNALAVYGQMVVIEMIFIGTISTGITDCFHKHRKIHHLQTSGKDAFTVVYKVGECVQELLKLLKEYESAASDKQPERSNVRPTLEIRIPAEHVCATNLQVKGGQLWGTDVYTDDSDLVAGVTGYRQSAPSQIVSLYISMPKSSSFVHNTDVSIILSACCFTSCLIFEMPTYMSSYDSNQQPMIGNDSRMEQGDHDCDEVKSIPDSRLKKGKGITREPVLSQTKHKQYFLFGQSDRSSPEVVDSFEAYSSMDTSPYQETFGSKLEI